MVDVAPFIQGASMSLGSLSPQAHELVAEIFNSLGMISKTGEGGESPVVNHPHAMAQMGSALFGVTNEFLHKAALEHKYAQGAKPGKGGKLLEEKVTRFIQEIRHVLAKTTLESPASVKDAQSIEELNTRVIAMIRNNPEVFLAAKIASNDQILAVVSGLVKAGYHEINIAGNVGGTGAASDDDVFHTGLPWKTSLVQVHDQLRIEGARDDISLVVGGNIQTWKDALEAILLGANKVELGTVLLVGANCRMLRKCNEGRTMDRPSYITMMAPHVPPNVAELLYAKLIQRGVLTFKGGIDGDFDVETIDSKKREELESDFRTILSQHDVNDVGVVSGVISGTLKALDLAKGGCSFGVATGDATNIRKGMTSRLPEARERLLDVLVMEFLYPLAQQVKAYGWTSLSDAIGKRHQVLTLKPHMPIDYQRLINPEPPLTPLDYKEPRGFVKPTVDEFIIAHRQEHPAQDVQHVRYSVDTTDIAIGAGLGGYSVEHPFGQPLRVELHGDVGQRFGTLAPENVTLELHGNALDHVGMALDGGTLIVHGSIGKDCLYSASSGALLVRDSVASHPGYRLTGATMVVGGRAGDRACQFMTGGQALFLGEVNPEGFAEGMTAGLAFVDMSLPENQVLREGHRFLRLSSDQKEQARVALTQFHSAFSPEWTIEEKLAGLRVYDPRSLDYPILDLQKESVPNASFAFRVFAKDKPFGRVLSLNSSVPLTIYTDGKLPDMAAQFWPKESHLVHVGNAGKQVGRWLDGGHITICGDADAEAGMEAASGGMLFLGNVGPGSFKDMKGGTAIVLGNLGNSPVDISRTLYGGSVFVRSDGIPDGGRPLTVAEAALLKEELAVQSKLLSNDKQGSVHSRGERLKALARVTTLLGMELVDLQKYFYCIEANHQSAVTASVSIGDIEDLRPGYIDPKSDTWDASIAALLYDGKFQEYEAAIKARREGSLLDPFLLVPPMLRIGVIGAGEAGVTVVGAIERQLQEVKFSLPYEIMLISPEVGGHVERSIAPWHPAKVNAEKLKVRVGEFSSHVQVVTEGVTPLSASQLKELSGYFSKMVIATGAKPRELEVPGKEFSVFGNDVAAYYNGKSDKPDSLRLDHPWALISGNGNVAGDVAQFLMQDVIEGCSPSVVAEHATRKTNKVIMAIRKTLPESKDFAMSPKQLGDIKNAGRLIVVGKRQDVPESLKVILSECEFVETLEDAKHLSDNDEGSVCIMAFGESVAAINQDSNQLGVTLKSGANVYVGSVVTCMGNVVDTDLTSQLPPNSFVTAGWAEKGVGLISDARASAERAASLIVEDVKHGEVSFRPDTRREIFGVLGITEPSPVSSNPLTVVLPVVKASVPALATYSGPREYQFVVKGQIQTLAVTDADAGKSVYRLLRDKGWMEKTSCDGEKTCNECTISSPNMDIEDLAAAFAALRDRKVFSPDGKALSCELTIDRLPPGTYKLVA